MRLHPSDADRKSLVDYRLAVAASRCNDPADCFDPQTLHCARDALFVDAASFNRERLVAAARNMFAARGYADVSVEEIAAAAGLTEGAVSVRCL
jgi:hypothetical protein